MAQKRGRQTEWPRVKREPECAYQAPDGVYRSGRTVLADYGNDRVSPRGFDPMGTSDTRAPPQEGSTRIPTSPEIRRR